MKIYENIGQLADYGIKTGLLAEEDKTFVINQLLELFHLNDYEQIAGEEKNLDQILNEMLDYAYEQGIIDDNGVTTRDLLDTKIMACLMPRPGEVIRQFKSFYQESPLKATEYYYKLSQDSNYIRRFRVSKDVKWVTDTEYGLLDVTINLSKPEKDPKAIAAALHAPKSGYPKCLLCKENEGYAGHLNHPARQNHRIIPITINKQPWFLQYSPYVYYNEHCIVFNSEHTPMKIDRSAFRKLLDFVELFPHYFVGSNADLPIVGGSILTHDHFQGGNYEFAMARAGIEKELRFDGFDDIEAGIVKWPMSVIRLRSTDSERLVELADKILLSWREYSDEEAFVLAYTEGIPHNTITPIARMKAGKYELDLVLRNNITTDEHPDGVYHPHKEHHHIKKENIGLIEVMGLAVLPARLLEEMAVLKDCMVKGIDVASVEQIAKHKDWTDQLFVKYGDVDETNIHAIIENEIGLVYAEILEQAGVFKRNKTGMKQFLDFVKQV